MGILPLLALGPPRLPMRAPNRMCPKCGADDVYVTTRTLDVRTRRPASISRNYDFFWGFTVFFLLSGLLYSVVPPLTGIDSGTFPAFLPCLPITLGVLTIVVLATLRSRRMSSSVEVRTFKCHTCNHEWDES